MLLFVATFVERGVISVEHVLLLGAQLSVPLRPVRPFGHAIPDSLARASQGR